MKNILLPALLCCASCLPTLAQSSQMRTVPAFHAINVGTGIELTLTAGHSQRVEVSAATPEYRDRIETTVADGVLTLRYKRDASQRNEHTNTYLRVAVTADELKALTAGSGSSVQAKGDFDANEFKLDVSSGASVKADIATSTLSVNQSSGSTVTLDGHATSASLEVGSGATFGGKDLKTDRCRAQASSGSSIKIAVKDDLVAQASSGASISYVGSPQVTKHVSSGGSVSGR